MNIRKAMAEQQIKRIRKQLEDLDAMDAQSKLQPMERTDDTYLEVTHQDQRAKLLKELEKYQKIVDEAEKK